MNNGWSRYRQFQWAQLRDLQKKYEQASKKDSSININKSWSSWRNKFTGTWVIFIGARNIAFFCYFSVRIERRNSHLSDERLVASFKYPRTELPCNRLTRCTEKTRCLPSLKHRKRSLYSFCALVPREITVNQHCWCWCYLPSRSSFPLSRGA